MRARHAAFLTVFLAAPALAADAPASGVVSKSAAEAPSLSRRETLAQMRREFLAAPLRSEDPTAAAPDLSGYADLEPLRAQADFVRAGRVEGFDDWPTYADMVVSVAQRLGVVPAESALALYRGRLRPSNLPLSVEESRARSSLLAAISEPDFPKRYLYIPGLIDSPAPEIAVAPPPPPAPAKKGKKARKVRVARGPELAPPPKPVSVIGAVDWDTTEQLADVADGNARNWNRRAKESARNYARRLRRLRKHCYEWVRRDITALGLWDDRLFRGEVPGTRRDPQRSIRAASFALAMAKVESAEALAARTPLRELNLRVDPIVRGAIIVFSQTACGADKRSGHIEIVTSVVPLRAASYKFHDVKSDCLVRASEQNKLHVYVPLKRDPPPAPKPQKA